MIIRKSLKLLSFKPKKQTKKRMYYDDLLQSQSKPNFYTPFFTRVYNSLEARDTGLNFKLHDRFSFGSSVEDIKKSMGTPDHEVENEKYHSHILMYRHLIGDFKSHCRLHFVQGKLFYFSHRFRYLNQHEQNLVINSLEFKYLQGAKVKNRTDFVIRDSSGNHLIVDQGVDLVIHNLSGDEVLQHLVEFELDLRVAKKYAFHSNQIASLLKAV